MKRKDCYSSKCLDGSNLSNYFKPSKLEASHPGWPSTQPVIHMDESSENYLASYEQNALQEQQDFYPH
jgi:hypothetical protein